MAKHAKKSSATVASAKRTADRAVANTFENYPLRLRAKLKTLRAMIFDVAAATDGVGTIEEALKWGQPSYLTAETGSGSTIRIGLVKLNQPQYAVYFHCQTDLVDTFRELYPNAFKFEGSRAIVFDLTDKVPERELRHCIGLALTYHLRKRKPAKKR